MNVNEYLEQYHQELSQSYNPNQMTVARHSGCAECGNNPWDNLFKKIRHMTGLLGSTVTDAIQSELSACCNEWAQAKADGRQAAVELTLWLDFFEWLNSEHFERE